MSLCLCSRSQMLECLEPHCRGGEGELIVPLHIIKLESRHHGTSVGWKYKFLCWRDKYSADEQSIGHCMIIQISYTHNCKHTHSLTHAHTLTHTHTFNASTSLCESAIDYTAVLKLLALSTDNKKQLGCTDIYNKGCLEKS